MKNRSLLLHAEEQISQRRAPSLELSRVLNPIRTRTSSFLLKHPNNNPRATCSMLSIAKLQFCRKKVLSNWKASNHKHRARIGLVLRTRGIKSVCRCLPCKASRRTSLAKGSYHQGIITAVHFMKKITFLISITT